MQSTCNYVAAAIHKFMCECSLIKGSVVTYPRWGGGSLIQFNVDNKIYEIQSGYYDGSSSIITAWSCALTHTDYHGILKEAYYTGNMEEVFLDSKLFESLEPNLSNLEVGDILLNKRSNAAMYQGAGMLSHMFYDEFNESRFELTDLYYDNWDSILRYNGRAN